MKHLSRPIHAEAKNLRNGQNIAYLFQAFSIPDQVLLAQIELNLNISMSATEANTIIDVIKFKNAVYVLYHYKQQQKCNYAQTITLRRWNHQRFSSQRSKNLSPHT